MRKQLLILLFALGVMNLVSAQESYLRCIEVIDNDSTRIQWVSPVDQGEFDRYEIYVKNNSGQFSLETTLTDYGQNEYRHPETPITEAPWQFFVITHTLAGTSIFSDTLKTIVPYLESQNNSSLAFLEWNSPREPLLPSHQEEFTIWRKASWEDQWQLAGSTLALDYTETATTCGADVSYRISLEDESGCSSYSYVVEDFFQDIVQPLAPRIDSISISPEGYAQIGWQASNSTDTRSYEVFKLSGNTWNKLPGNPQGIDSTFFADSSFNSCNTPVTYAVGATDSCNNRTGNPYQFAHQSIGLSYQTDACTDSISLIWTGYRNMVSGLGGYQIFYSVNQDNFREAGSTAAGDTSFIHTPAYQAGDKLCYFVRAFSNDNTITASSCRICFTAHKPEEPDTLYIHKASVGNNGQVTISFRTDQTAYQQGFVIERSGSATGFTEIERMEQQDVIIRSFQDENANPSQQAYYYQIKALDSCFKSALTSNKVKTIHLSGEAQANAQNKLQWNTYEGFENGVANYELIRYEEGQAARLLEIPSGSMNYEDMVSDRISGSGIFTYRIRAFSNPTSYNTIDTVWSNAVTLQQAPGLFMPNAFSPNGDGKNDVFRPLFKFVPEGDYLFRIFNRWGELMFETSDKSEGWNGQYRGRDVEPGTYIYHVRYTELNNQPVEKKGSVTIVR